MIEDRGRNRKGHAVSEKSTFSNYSVGFRGEVVVPFRPYFQSMGEYIYPGPRGFSSWYQVCSNVSSDNRTTQVTLLRKKHENNNRKLNEIEIIGNHLNPCFCKHACIFFFPSKVLPLSELQHRISYYIPIHIP